MTSLIPTPNQASNAAANVFDKVFRGGLADLRPTPASIIEEAPQCTVFRYLVPDDGATRELPVLLVPPLAVSPVCFDLRRGCSLVEHMLALGHPTYLVEYGEIGYSDRDLGLEHWVEDVLPRAIRRVSEDNGGAPVQLVGWCLGGIMGTLAVAGEPSLPVQSISMIASPFDFTRVRLISPIRPVANLTNGLFLSAVYRAMGGAPAPLVRRGFQMSSLDKYLTKPLTMLSRLDDRDFLAQLEAVDNFVDQMRAYPGRTFGQLYHRFFRVNDMADDGVLELGDRRIDLADVRVPILSVAGSSDTLAPRPAVHAVGDLLVNAPEVRLETAPGGHLGVLTGRSAKRSTWIYVDEFLARHGSVPAPAPEPGERPRLRVVA